MLSYDEIAAAITFGFPLRRTSGLRPLVRSGWGGCDFEPVEKSLAREVQLVQAPHLREDWVWGREQFMTRRTNTIDLIAWTVDRSGRIVRGWRRTKRDRYLASAYHPAGQFCPVEAAWLPSVTVGEFSFPAYPFLHVLQGGRDPEALDTVNALWAMRPSMQRFW